MTETPLPETPAPRFTLHALARLRQRGIREGQCTQVLDWADTARDVGGNCHAVSCSAAGLRRARAGGVPPQLLERLAGLVLIIGADGVIVTVVNRPTWFARFQRGHARLSSRERARMAARRERGSRR